MHILESVLVLGSGIGVFLVGMLYFSETLTRSASGPMKLLFKRVTNNRAASFGMGFGVTAVTQSVTVTTVMVVGLVNAGLLTLLQATAVIFGANVGSAVTSVIMSLSSFNIKYFFMAIAFLGAFTKLLTKNERAVLIADLLIGFGVLFVGLYIMSNSLASNPTISDAFGKVFASVNFPLLLILLGILFTFITQSSTAVTAIIITLTANGELTFGISMYLLIGASTGSTLTAVLAAITANTNAKRASMIHLLFNLFGAVMFTAILWPLQGIFIPFYTGIITDNVWQISIFDIIFNITTALVLIWFIKPLNNLTIKMIKEVSHDEDILRPTFISSELLENHSEALKATIKEIKDMATYARDSLKISFCDLVDRVAADKVKIFKDNERINFLHQAITQYLIQISNLEKVDSKTKKLIGEYYHFTNDVKRIAGHSIYMINNVFKMKEQGLRFSEEIKTELVTTFEELNSLYNLFLETFEEKDTTILNVVATRGTELKNFCDSFSDSYLNRLTLKHFSVVLGDFYYATMISFRSISSYISRMATSMASNL